jgi:hypothetical protein
VDRDDCRLSEAEVQGSLPRVSIRDLEGMRFARADPRFRPDPEDRAGISAVKA